MESTFDVFTRKKGQEGDSEESSSYGEEDEDELIN